jgi:hypothetical protein
MTPFQLTGDGVDGVQELDGVHGGPRSEAQCQADFPLQQGLGEALRLIRYCSVNFGGLAVSCVGLTPIFADRDLPMPRLRE